MQDQTCSYTNYTTIASMMAAGQTIVNDTNSAIAAIRLSAAKTACTSVDPLCQICSNSTTCLYCTEARSGRPVQSYCPVDSTMRHGLALAGTVPSTQHAGAPPGRASECGRRAARRASRPT